MWRWRSHRLLLLLFYALVALALRDQLRLILRDLLLLRTHLDAPPQLLQIHIVFKHGHRAPFRLYEVDPNPEDLWEEGLGFLTKLGRLQMYSVGRHLRQRYAAFLSGNPDEIRVQSSVADRCLYSAYSFLAGFYPPDEEWSFAEGLPWQPIPVHYVPDTVDNLLQSDPNCPRYEASKRLNDNTEEVVNFNVQYQWYYEFWQNHSQKLVRTHSSAGDLYKTLSVERDMNYTIPEWALQYWDTMVMITDMGYYFNFKTKLQQRLRAGPILGLMLDRMKEKITENSLEKVFLYSGHGSNIAAIQCALQSYDMKHSPHAATIVQELYQESTGLYSTRFLFFNSSHPDQHMEAPYILHLQGCPSHFCPLETYESVIKDLVPEDWKEECLIKTLLPDAVPIQYANWVQEEKSY